MNYRRILSYCDSPKERDLVIKHIIVMETRIWVHFYRQHEIRIAIFASFAEKLFYLLGATPEATRGTSLHTLLRPDDLFGVLP